MKCLEKTRLILRIISVGYLCYYEARRREPCLLRHFFVYELRLGCCLNGTQYRKRDCVHSTRGRVIAPPAPGRSCFVFVLCTMLEPSSTTLKRLNSARQALPLTSTLLRLMHYLGNWNSVSLDQGLVLLRGITLYRVGGLWRSTVVHWSFYTVRHFLTPRLLPHRQSS